MKRKRRKPILKEGKELEISSTKMDSLFYRCSSKTPTEHLKSLYGIKRILLRLSCSLPFLLIIFCGDCGPGCSEKIGKRKNFLPRQDLAVDLLVKNPEEKFLLIKPLLLIGIKRSVSSPDLPFLPQSQIKPSFALHPLEAKDG